MAKKMKVTQAQARQWVDDVLEATDSLLVLIDDIGKCNVEDFDPDGADIASTLACIAQRASKTAVSVLSHCSLSEQHRKLAALERERKSI